jgi:hypothetical protein
MTKDRIIKPTLAPFVSSNSNTFFDINPGIFVESIVLLEI